MTDLSSHRVSIVMCGPELLVFHDKHPSMSQISSPAGHILTLFFHTAISKPEMTILSRTSPVLFSFYIVKHLPYVKDFDSLLSNNRTAEICSPNRFLGIAGLCTTLFVDHIISSLEGILVLTSPSQVTLIYIQTTSDKRSKRRHSQQAANRDLMTKFVNSKHCDDFLVLILRLAEHEHSQCIHKVSHNF